jgi:hypothetical protein
MWYSKRQYRPLKVRSADDRRLDVYNDGRYFGTYVKIYFTAGSRNTIGEFRIFRTTIDCFDGSVDMIQSEMLKSDQIVLGGRCYMTNTIYHRPAMKVNRTIANCYMLPLCMFTKPESLLFHGRY